MLLFPRLPTQVAQAIAEELASLSQDELVGRSALENRAAWYGATGGNRVSSGQLQELQAEVRKVTAGLKGEGIAEQRRRFDAQVTQLIHGLMPMTPNEAAKPGVWAFVGCVLLPDAVRFRYPGEGGSGTNTERFLGANRGMRNTIGRLWWRAFTLHDPTASEPWALVDVLGEDEMVQIMERPTIAGHPPLARSAARSLIELSRDTTIPRSNVMRDVGKRIQRRASLVPLEALSEEELQQQVRSLFGETLGPQVIAATSLTTVAPPSPARAAPIAEVASSPETVTPTDVATQPNTTGRPFPASPLRYPVVFERLVTAQDIRSVGREDDVMLISRVDATLLPLADHAEVLVTDERLGLQWAWHFKKRHGLRGRLDSSYLVSGVHNYLVTAGASYGQRLRLEGRRTGPWLVSISEFRR